jgi:hypothetical protein
LIQQHKQHNPTTLRAKQHIARSKEIILQKFWRIFDNFGSKKIRVICVLAKYLLPLHRILRHNLWQAYTYISLFANRGAATATSSRLLNSRGERTMHMQLSPNSTTVGTYSPNPFAPSTSVEAPPAKCHLNAYE